MSRLGWTAGSVALGLAIASGSIAAHHAVSGPEADAVRAMVRQAPMGSAPATLFDFGDQPNYFAARVVHQAILWLPGNDFGSVATVWILHGLALGFIALAVRTLRSPIGGCPLGAGSRAVLAAVFVALAVSPRFGANWLFSERVGFLLPFGALAAGLWVWHHPRASSRWRERGGGAAAVVAAFSGLAGVGVFAALMPVAYWRTRSERGPWAAGRVALRLALVGSAAVWLVHDQAAAAPGITPGPRGLAAMRAVLEGVSVEGLTVWGLVEHVAFVFGQAWPAIEAVGRVDQWVAGGLWLSVLVVLGVAILVERLRRRSVDRQAWMADPGVAWLVFGGVAGGAIALEQFPVGAAAPLLTARCWPIGAMALGGAAWLVRRGRMGTRVALVVGLGALAPIGWSWSLGIDRQFVESRYLRQAAALQAVLPAHEVQLPASVQPAWPSRRRREALRSAGRLRSDVDLRARTLAQAIERAESRPLAVGGLLTATPSATQIGGFVARAAAADLIVVTLDGPEVPVRLLAIAAPEWIGTPARSPAVLWRTALRPPTTVDGARIRWFALVRSRDRDPGPEARVPELWRLPGSLVARAGVFERVENQ